MSVNPSKSAWKKVVDKAFPGNAGIKIGKPNIKVSTAAASGAAKVGTLWWDNTNSDVYICTASGGTWVKINA